MQGFSFQDDDVDDHLNRQMTEQFNFGGGLFEKKTDSADPDADPDRHRSKKEVWHQLHVINLPQPCKAAMSCPWNPILACVVCLSLQNTTVSTLYNMHQKLLS